MGDTGGDHDLYDYCVDDPVSMNDPSGLFPPALLLLAGMAGSAGIGLGGAYGAAKIVDAIKELQEGKESSVARDAIKTVAPHAVDIHTKAFQMLLLTKAFCSLLFPLFHLMLKG